MAAVAWGAARGRANILQLSSEFSPARSLAGAAAGLALAGAVVFLSRYAVHRLEWARHLHQEFRHLLGPLTSGEIFIIAFASSVGEECFFRGALLPHLHLWLSSALFALPHIGPSARFLPWTATSFLIGLAFGGLFLLFGDLGGPIVAHFTINLLNLRYIAQHDLA